MHEQTLQIGGTAVFLIVAVIVVVNVGVDVAAHVLASTVVLAIVVLSLLCRLLMTPCCCSCGGYCKASDLSWRSRKCNIPL